MENFSLSFDLRKLTVEPNYCTCYQKFITKAKLFDRLPVVKYFIKNAF
jgi:hypothetical protein